MSRADRTDSLDRWLIALSVLPAVCLGILVSTAPNPELIVVIGAIALVGGTLLVRLGSQGALMMVLFATIIIPVTSEQQIFAQGAIAEHGSTLRAVLLVALTLFAVCAIPAGARERNPGSTTISLLLALAAVGVGVATVNAEGSGDFASLLSQAAGQPLLYAGLLFAFVRILREGEGARGRLLAAWSAGAILEAALIVGQLATSAAFDPLRGITRASGTAGADFVGAFGALTVFAMLELRRTGRTPTERLLGTAGIVAGIVAMIGSVSRGPTVAFVIGLCLLVLSTAAGRTDPRRARRLVAVGGVVFVFVLALFLLQGPWTARLSSSAGSGFDRPQTWVSAVRIAEDNPVTGVGSTRLASVVNDNPRYYETPYGITKVNPHNAWLYALASSGAIYALILLAATIAFIRAVWRCRGDPSGHIARCALAAAALMFGINNLFTHPEVMVYLLCLGALAMTPGDRSGTDERRA
jgi:hypothetical protein